MMQNKNIIVGVTGGIAAYKSASLVSALRKMGANTKVVMTKNAREFITPLTMQTLSGHKVYTEMFDKDLAMDLEHIALARFADAIIIAPASANFISKLANGMADDLLSTVCLATIAPIAIVPAMNKEMWQMAVTQANIELLKSRGSLIFGPAAGEQACGEVGLGRMIEPEQILNLIPKMFASKILFGKKVVITAGPTRENIDPVRYISNYSSGKMGYALAEAALDAGAEVVLVSGPTSLECSEKIKKISIQTAEEMEQAVMHNVSGADIFIGVAAISDYRPINFSDQKIKKNNQEISLELEPTTDILAKISSSSSKIFCVGFAAETDNLLEYAKEKLKNKNLDMIIVNQVGSGIGFDSDENQVTILDKSNQVVELPKMSKAKLAEIVIELIQLEGCKQCSRMK